jgi:hypothetical protein
MILYLGTHRPHWLALTDTPLFVSRRWLATRKTLPAAQGRWVLDSGGFTELSLYGEWRTTHGQYLAEVERFRQIGGLDWVAPRDWMCEPFILEKTGRTVANHQSLTVSSYLYLREKLGDLVIPVLQGWEPDDYCRCWEIYGRNGVDLEQLPVVGIGSVCRRQNTAEAGRIIRSLRPLRLHGFGVKITGLRSFDDRLTSADSMAWSYHARHNPPLPDCPHTNCANCRRYAERWYRHVQNGLAQTRLEIPCAV